MAKKPAEQQQHAQQQQKARPDIETEQTSAHSGAPGLVPGLIGGADDPTIQAQAARLSDMRFRTAQRQAMASQIGRVAGARYLQRVMSAVKRADTGRQQPTKGTDRNAGATKEPATPEPVSAERLTALPAEGMLSEAPASDRRSDASRGRGYEGRPTSAKRADVAVAVPRVKVEQAANRVQPAAIGAARPIIQRDEPEAVVEEEGAAEEEVIEVPGRTVAEEEGVDADVWTYTAASDPEEVLNKESSNARREYEYTRDVVKDVELLLSNINDMKRKYDKKHLLVPQETVSEFRGRIALFSSALTGLLGQVPSTERRQELLEELTAPDYEYTYNILTERREMTPESRALWNEREEAFEYERSMVEAQIESVAEGFNNLYWKVSEARDEMKPHVRKLAEAEAGEYTADMNTLNWFAALLKGKELEEFIGYMEEKGRKIEALETIADSSKFSGELLDQYRSTLQGEREAEAGLLLISRARSKIATYIRIEFSKRWESLTEALWDEGASSVIFSDGFRKFEDKVDDMLRELEALEDDYIGKDPYETDAAAFAAAVDAQIAKIDASIDSAKAIYAPIGRSIELVEGMQYQVETSLSEHREKVNKALPDIKEALVQQRIVRALEAEQRQLQQDMKTLESGHSVGRPETLEAREEEIRAIPANVRKEVEPIWFTYSADLKTLEQQVAKGTETGEYTEEDLKSVKGQLNLAELLGRYHNWYDLIAAARQSILEEEDPETRERELAELEKFEKQVSNTLKTELEAIIDPDKLKDVWQQLDSVNGDIQLFVSSPGVKDVFDMRKFVGKTANQAAWKAITAGGATWQKQLGTLKNGVDKGTNAVGMLINAHKILKAGDAVDLTPGASHPALDAVAAGLDAVNTFNKVPVFKQLVDVYVVVIERISKGLAAISQKMAQYRLQLRAIGVELGGPVMR